jgi:hypothetical protein
MTSARTTAATRKPASRDPYAVRTPNGRSRLSNGTRGIVLPGVDQRSAIARRFRDVIAAVVSDLGGTTNTSETKVHLVRRFAALVVQAEAMEAQLAEGKQIDASAHAHISSTLVRLASRIGVDRVPKLVGQTLAEIQREYEQS